MLLSCGDASTTSAGGAFLIAEPAVLDLGTIGSLASVESFVELVNLSRTTIKIDRVEGGCSCTVPQLAERMIPPNTSVRLPVHYNPAGRQGPQQESVKVYWGAYSMVIPVHAHVEDSLRFEPSVLEFLSVAGEQIEPERVSITALGDTPFRVLGIEAPDYLRVTAPPPDVEGFHAFLEFEMIRRLPIGSHPATVIIRTSDPNQPVIHLGSVVVLSSALLAEPSNLFVRADGSEQPGETTIRVWRRDMRPFAITRVRALGDESDLAFEHRQERGLQHDVRVIFSTDLALGKQLRRRIEIVGDETRGEVLQIPVLIASVK